MTSKNCLRGQFESTVKSNFTLCREHFRLVLHLRRSDRFPSTRPGQFVQLACRDAPRDATDVFEWEPGIKLESANDELRAPVALLRRPFSLAGRRDSRSGVELHIIHRIVGVGTDWLSRLKPGDPVNVLGPLGNEFKLPGKEETAVLVGGGVGIPPMLYLAEKLRGRKAVAFVGTLSRDLLPLSFIESRSRINDSEPRHQVAEFSRYGIPSVITTDDGSLGYRGFVTQALEDYLRCCPSTKFTIYTCGPEPMMKRVAEIAASHGCECQIAVERAMACGMGTCQSCCIKVKKPDPAQPPLAGRDWAYRLACTDGPVFRAADLLW